MPKDKYEPPDRRRCHTIMSPEDLARGKQSRWFELEISGPIRNVSPKLWEWHHLTSLFLNDNNLHLVPPEICRLENLMALDLSQNKIRSLPAELGDMYQLRELLLNNNHLRVLPYEIGKLFQLISLGLSGNPLNPEILNLFNEHNGTTKLMQYMLDNLAITSSQPPQRPWIPLANPERRKPTAIFTVMCYNVLCDKYCTSQLYGYTASWALNWEYRKKGIIEEIRHYSADIITLQEVETEMYFNFFLPELKRDGYDGIFSPKSRARTMSETEKKHVDGCAVFYRTTKFGLIKEHLIEFNQVAMANADGAEQMLNRVMTKDNIALAALLETKEGAFENEVPPESQVRQPVLVTTAHVHWDPEFCDVKLIQTMMLMQEIKQLVKDYTTSLRPGATVPDANSIPLILCGDLNSLPDSGVIEYLSEGKVPASHVDFKNMGYLSSLQKMNATDNKEIFSHGFRIAKAYDTDIMPYTNYTFDFKGIIDYIFYSTDHMRPLGVLGPLDPQWFIDNKVIGCPHPHIPSDHFSLLVEYEMSPSNIQLSLSSSSGSTNSTKNGTSNNNGHR
ncbi:unnamed protein product [Owenia fusiformis]|uniref:poly(A)-specific ribonuclease n=1 Tax=Owenia fusiformis TaxID=6347 RepID=A0A8J1Y5R0_OWEFU|nr:unnamed protein product [Owenia fusiformis]